MIGQPSIMHKEISSVPKVTLDGIWARNSVTTQSNAFSSSPCAFALKSKVESTVLSLWPSTRECRSKGEVLDASQQHNIGFIWGRFHPDFPAPSAAPHLGSPHWALQPYPVLFPLSFAVPGHSEQGRRSRQTLQLGNCPLEALQLPGPHRLLTLNLFLLSFAREQCLWATFSYSLSLHYQKIRSAISKMQKHEEK